jgi:glycosyltransferase involved in cell wall biosynthesis
MRIGVYDPYLDDLGGGEKYMMTIAECLAKEHEVSVFWDVVDDIDAIKKRFSLGLEGVSVVKNIFSPQVGTWERLSETNKYDALIVLSDGSIPLVLSRKLFIHLQQPIEHMDTTSIKGMFKLSKVTAVFYNSKFTKSYNEKKLGKVKNMLVYPPVEVTHSAGSGQGSEKKENIIMHVGRFRLSPPRPTGLSTPVKQAASLRSGPQEGDDFKKQGVMVDAFKKMVDAKLKDWKFVIAASVKKEDEEAFSQLQEEAKGYPIEFMINKSNDELWEMYSRAKIYWHASGYGEDLEKNPEYAEHFGISTVEAMGAGAVPVVINAGGQREIVEDNKDGLLWNTLDELQQKTRELINDEALWKRMSESAKAKSKEFSRELFCEAVNKLVRGEE